MSQENWVTYELGAFKDDPDNASCSNTVITDEISGLLLFNQPRHRRTPCFASILSNDALFFIGMFLEHTIGLLDHFSLDLIFSETVPNVTYF